MEVETFTQGQPAPAAPAPAPEIPNDPARSTMSEVRAAAQRLAARRQEKRAEAATPTPSPEPEIAPAPTESPPQEVEAAPTPEQVESPSGMTETDEPADVPSLDPPRSWTSDDREAFNALPRETQARLVELDRARELEVRRVQNEIADQRKAGEAERMEMEQARQQYEQALPMLLQTFQSSAEFADIQSQADVDRLAAEDWPRWVQFQNHREKIKAIHQELQTAQQRQQSEWSDQWQQYASKEDQTFAEKFPDSVKLREPAINYLKAAGFSDHEIAENWNNKAWRDHRMQGVILDAVKWRQAQAKKAEAIKQPVPPVQRPGVSQPKPHPHAAEIQSLLAKGSLSLREATRLNMLRNAKA